jgi:demethylmenaquinone methyltransferase/2-methoxy-6-polyprenyl-1,4-benzoquinol methylase
MAALPFPEGAFDLITTGYGLRNVPELQVAIAEMHRVLRPGGRALSLDFNRPGNPIIRALYLRYLAVVGGAVGWALHRDPDTYRYIPASIRNYPGAEGVSALMKAAGFSRVEHHRVLGGLMAIHHAVR